MKDTVSLMDVLLTMAANRLDSKLFKTRKLGTLLNWCLRLLLLMSVSAQACYICQELGKIKRMTPYGLTAVNMVFMTAASATVFAFRRHDIEKLVKVLTHGHRATRYQKNLCVIGLVLAFIYIICGLCGWVHMGQSMSQDNVDVLMFVLMMVPSELNQFTIVYPVVYAVVLDMMTQYELHSLNSMMKNLVSGQSAIAMIRERKHVMRMKQTFEQLFSIIPFAMLALPFITVPGTISRISDQGISGLGPVAPGEVVFFVTIHVGFAVVIILLIECVTRARNIIKERISEVIFLMQERFAHQLHSTGHQALIDELKADQEFRFSGWHLFSIERTVYLVFMSALVSTTVLVIEVENNAKRA